MCSVGYDKTIKEIEDDYWESDGSVLDIDKIIITTDSDDDNFSIDSDDNTVSSNRIAIGIVTGRRNHQGISLVSLKYK